MSYHTMRFFSKFVKSFSRKLSSNVLAKESNSISEDKISNKLCSFGRHKISIPQELKNYEVKSVVCGNGFSAFVVEDEESHDVLFGEGLNTDNNNFFDVPHKINLSLANSKSKINKLSAGRAHLLVLTDEGVFAMGNNSFGQCGYSQINQTKMNTISKIDDQKLVDICAGLDHSLILTENGKVYSTGWGADGQTGIENFEVTTTFSRVKGDIEDEFIVKLAGTGDFALALNEKGDVFGWGNVEYDQIPIPNTQQCNIPTYLKNCKHLGRIVDIAAGGSFCAVLDSKGVVHVWGYGLLGSYPINLKARNSNIPLKVSPYLFGYSDFRPHVKVVAIDAGLFHMAALTNTGDLYTWGRNKWGCLGLNLDKDQPFPLKVPTEKPIRSVSCGVVSTAAIFVK